MENETLDTLEAVETSDNVHLSPLSIQAAALVRSIDALSSIFWISLGGTFLTVFFAGLNRLETNATTDFIFLGEYQVPKSILPLATLSFALFAFWMTSNRLRMLCYVLRTSQLPRRMVHEIFHLNPPVLHVFDRDNTHRWSPFTGVAVLILNWAVFFGNSIALTLSSAVQQAASLADFDFLQMSTYAVLIIAILAYGMRSIYPPLRDILTHLHGISFTIGWPRAIGGLLMIIGVVLVNNIDQFTNPAEDQNSLIGPGMANAIDGETLFIEGVEVNLFGIDASEPGQICHTAEGEEYPCGRAATLALQQLLQDSNVVCLSMFAVNESKVVGICRLLIPGEPQPQNAWDFSAEANGDASNLSRIMVAMGHALGVGMGARIFQPEQKAAQDKRVGIWQGAFEPPATWRARH